MCRWLAYSGSPMLIKEVLYAPAHSLIDQSLHSQLGAEPTNGDGFGVGWYGEAPTPRGCSTASSLPGTTRTSASSRATSAPPLFFAHIRAAIGSRRAADQLPPVPARPVAVHAQRVRRRASQVIKRDLVLAVDESLYPGDHGPGRH